MSYQDDIICKKHGCNYCFDNPYGWGESYCPKCAEEDYHLNLQAEAEACSRIQLCLQCNNYIDGDPLNGSCLVYPEMSTEMFGRKKKCKYYVELRPVAWNDGWENEDPNWNDYEIF